MINIIVTIVTFPNGEVFFYCPDFRYNRHIVRKGEEMMLDERVFSERLKTEVLLQSFPKEYRSPSLTF